MNLQEIKENNLEFYQWLMQQLNIAQIPFVERYHLLQALKDPAIALDNLQKLYYADKKITQLTSKLALTQTPTTSTASYNSTKDRNQISLELEQFNSQKIHPFALQLKQLNPQLSPPEIKAILCQIIIDCHVAISHYNKSLPETTLITYFNFTTKFNLNSLLLEKATNLTTTITNLAKDITKTQPPGKLLITKENTQYNPDYHELAVGCDEDSQISYCLFPGYSQNDKLINKVKVFTKKLS